MKKLLDRYQIENVKTFTRKIASIDISINIAAGFLLVFAPNSVNEFLFSSLVLPNWVYLIIGVGFLLFVIWQLLFFNKPAGFTVQNLKVVAVLSWLPCLLFTMGLISTLSIELYPFPKIFLWIANVYMLLLGGLYWFLAFKIKNRNTFN